MAETSGAGRSMQAQLQQLPGAVGVPIQVLILAGAAFVAVLVGTVSVGAGFALFVLGLLALVIVDYMMFQQEQPTSNEAVASFVRRGQEQDKQEQEAFKDQVVDQQRPQE